MRSLLLIFLLFATANAEEKTPPLVEFMPSIHREGLDYFPYKHFSKPGTENAHKLSFLEKLYTQNLRPENPQGIIPKVVHQIWLGSLVPKKFEGLMKTWMALNGFQYKLWTDKEAAEMPMQNRKLFDALKNYGAKSDVLRYEILYQEGGLYVDTDFECVNPSFFRWAHEQYDFYAGIETLAGSPKIHVCTALLGAKKGHLLLKKVVEGLANTSKDAEIIDGTGPGYFTKKFFEYYQNPVDTVDIAFTPPYFYPLAKVDTKLKEKEKKKLLKKETAAIHHWGNTWLK